MGEMTAAKVQYHIVPHGHEVHFEVHTHGIMGDESYEWKIVRDYGDIQGQRVVGLLSAVADKRWQDVLAIAAELQEGA